ncbi:MAG TPA: S-layer homology domain-containing protein, partial [Bacilli bacterium]|nr:S-layer homology domain-containing protein [Bacilli bacterium]
DGKKVAVLKRNGNSTYAVLENSVSFTDIDASWAKADIELLANKLLVNGYNDGSFNPAGNITRAEFVTLLARGLGFEQNAADASFSDVTADDWYAGYLQPIVDAGIVNGFEDGTFRANNNITRQDAVVMLTRAVEFLNLRGDVTAEQADSALANFSDNGQIASYAQEAVGVTTSLDIIHGNTDGTFNPTGTANRAEAVKMLENLLLKANFLSI